MWEQEKVHRNKFEELIQQRRVRPSLLFPLWHCAGYILGAGKNNIYTSTIFLNKNKIYTLGIFQAQHSWVLKLLWPAQSL